MENFIFCAVFLELWVQISGDDYFLMYIVTAKSYNQLFFYVFHFEFMKYRVLVFLLCGPIG